MQPLRSFHSSLIFFGKENNKQNPESSFTTNAHVFTFPALPQNPCARVDVSEMKLSVHPKKHFQETILTSHWKLRSLRSQISRNFLCFFQPIPTKFKKTRRKTPRIPYPYQHSKRMPTEEGNKPRNVHPAHQVLSTLHTDPCSYPPFPQESHHSSSIPEHSTNWNPNKQRGLRGKDFALLAGQVNYVYHQDFCQRQSRLFPARGQKKTYLTKNFLQVPQLNSPDVISFVAIRLYLLVHILIKTTQAKIICLLMTLFFS